MDIIIWGWLVFLDSIVWGNGETNDSDTVIWGS